jgi:hypothetical protein
LSLALLERAELPRFRGKTLISLLITVLRILLHRLEFISTSFYTMRLGVREFQRVFLELRAFLDFEEHYRYKTMSSETALQLMGTFTSDPFICEGLFQAGVPVWLVRPYSDLRSIRIRALAPLKRAVNILPLEPSTHPKYPSIYRGRGDTLEKYSVLSAQTLSYLKYPNPFGSVRAKRLVTPPPVLSKREIRSQRYTPCKPSWSLVLVRG